jgi:hypothetical protein
MKKNFTKSVFFIFGILFFISKSNAQINNNVGVATSTAYSYNTELIFGVSKMTDKTIPIITEGLKKINGVEFHSICESHKLVLLRYDESKIISPEKIIEELVKQNIRIPMLVKKGTFNSVSEICSK